MCVLFFLVWVFFFFLKHPTASKSNFLQVLQVLGCGAVASVSLSDPGLRKNVAANEEEMEYY